MKDHAKIRAYQAVLQGLSAANTLRDSIDIITGLGIELPGAARGYAAQNHIWLHEAREAIEKELGLAQTEDQYGCPLEEAT